jgi:uncharacterized protein (TIGR00288 family)
MLQREFGERCTMARQSDQSRIAVLFDGDNAQASLLPQILAEISRFGLATVKRIYGDWTTTSMSSWKGALNKHAIQPIQQFRYTVGKNATDSAMIIDAMDLLHSHDVDGFCIVSSDSDFTRLATRIREEGLFVIGVGKEKTPEAFTNACDQFIYSENLAGTATPKAGKKKAEPRVSDPKPLLLQAFEMAAKEEEWVYLAAMGDALHKLAPAFDPRTYGHSKLQSIIADYPETFSLKRDDSKPLPVIYVALTAKQAKTGRR